MELSFALSAIRRRLWLVLLFVILGALPGLLMDAPVGNEYQSTAMVWVEEPTLANATFTSPGEADRYVQGQLAVLEGAGLINTVAADNNLSAAVVADAVQVEQQPGSSVVMITATVAGDATTTPELARRLAQSYLDNYMETLETERSDDAYITKLDLEIARVNAQLGTVNEEIEEKMQRFLDMLGRPNVGAVPNLSEVAPGLATERNLLEAQLIDLVRERSAQASNARLRVNTMVIQNAPLPLEPNPVGGRFALVGGLLTGAMVGVIAAMAWARFSAKVLDEDTASEILGVPVVADFPYYRSLARRPLVAFQSLPRSAVGVVEQLCVRAESKAGLGQPLCAVVVGTQRNAGATTLALAMAERFASTGSSVVVVDADVRDPQITALFNGATDGGIPAVVANDGGHFDSRGRSVFTRTMDPEVSVLGLGPNRGAASLRRDTVASVLQSARRKGQIVVVDGGPALELASTLQFTALADAVVLALPLANQKVDDLDDLSRELADIGDRLLPVVTAPARRPARSEGLDRSEEDRYDRPNKHDSATPPPPNQHDSVMPPPPNKHDNTMSSPSNKADERGEATAGRSPSDTIDLTEIEIEPETETESGPETEAEAEVTPADHHPRMIT